jgi:hypothetical protein
MKDHRLKETEDASTGFLAVCALICGFVVFALYMREKINTTSAAVGSIRLSSTKYITHEPARFVDRTGSVKQRHLIATAVESTTTRVFGSDVKSESRKKIVRGGS